MPEKILVHEKALGHLTRGLYRSPASAIRELVSNAWDANATEVRVSTGRPSFHQITVSDNGDGFTKEQFVRLMAGFGSSDKRIKDKPLKYGRKTIGRLGIGMLGIAQICGSFLIRSRPKHGRGFKAEIRLSENLRERLDQEDSTVVEQSQLEEADSRDGQRVMVGEYDFLPDDGQERTDFGTTIESTDLIPTFSYAFRTTYEQITGKITSSVTTKTDRGKARKPFQIPTTWSGFLRRCSASATVQELGDYWRFIWDLAALTPIPYVSATCLPRRAVAKHHARLLRNRFRVLLDEMELRKPVDLTGNPGGYTTVRIPPTTKAAFQRQLTFSGYIVVQEGRQLRPSEHRGTLVRIRDVAVGLYDASLLDYRINEGPRSRWLTSELFVDTGLEDALNIDRDSFNRYSPEFQVLQREYHKILQSEVFPEVYRQIDKRARTRQNERVKTHLGDLAQSIELTLADRGVQVHVEVAKSVAEPRVRLSGRQIRIKLPREGLTGTGKAHRDLAAAIVAIYDVAQEERDANRRRGQFVALLRNLLRHW